MQLFNNLPELIEYFKEPQTCIDFLTKLRWSNKINCVFCNCDKVYELKGANKRYKCSKCRKQFSVVKGTIFENSPIPLKTWYAAVYLITSHKKGISSAQLGRDLGVTQGTAWFMAQRIRYALKVKSFNKPLDVVQCDETFMGGKNKNRHADKKVKNSQGRSFKDKTPVLGMLSNEGVKTVVIPDTKATTIKPIIAEFIEKGSILITDEWLGYNTVSKKDYTRIIVNHKEGEYVRGAFHTNSIEGFWSILKRGIYGIYHQVSPKHLHRYCDEFSFRYNTRKISCEERFALTLKGVNCRLSYKDLIKENEVKKAQNNRV